MQLTKSEKINLGTTEISKLIREQLKQKFPRCKFSVTTDYYSMGSSILVCLMKADRPIFLDEKEISDLALFRLVNDGLNKEEDIRVRQKENYHQLNQFVFRDDYNKDSWNNGVFLTEEGFNLLKEVVRIVDYYNYDDSDSQTDYYSVNFSFSIHIGKFDKPFER